MLYKINRRDSYGFKLWKLCGVPQGDELGPVVLIFTIRKRNMLITSISMVLFCLFLHIIEYILVMSRIPCVYTSV